MHAGARVYRDLVGIAHQRIAAMADEVHLLVAGLPIRLKGRPSDATTATPEAAADQERSTARSTRSGRSTRPRWRRRPPASTA